MVTVKVEQTETPIIAETNNGETTVNRDGDSETKKESEQSSKKKDSFRKPCPASKKPKKTIDDKPDPAEDAKKEEKKDQSKPTEDALILSAEEEEEVAAETNEDAVKNHPKEEKSSVKDAKKRKDAQKNIWISNISRSTKATDLKKLFSDKGIKVDSAKVVTNGKSFFGYICLESPELAQKSVKELNGLTLNNKKIVVSLSRPDLRSGKAPEPTRRPRDGRTAGGAQKNAEKAATDKKKGDVKETSENGSEPVKDANKETSEETKTESPEEAEERRRRREQRHVRQINDLKTELNRITTELQNNRRRLNDATRRLDAERERKATVRREIESLESQLKSEKRRHAQELEQLEKKRKLDEVRYQDDRAMLNRELDECRKIREFLQRKIDDFGMARRGRPSPHRSLDRSSDKIHRPRLEGRGGRSPPPPPKLNSRRSRDRSPPPYKNIKKSRPNDDGPSGKHAPYGNSHYSSQSSYTPSSSKPLLEHYPQSSSSGSLSRGSMYGSTAYPESGRYGTSASYGTGAYSISNPPSLMSRPMGYPGSGSGQRKY